MLKEEVFNEIGKLLERFHRKYHSTLLNQEFYLMIEKKHPEFYSVFKELKGD